MCDPHLRFYFKEAVGTTILQSTQDFGGLTEDKQLFKVKDKQRAWDLSTYKPWCVWELHKH